MKITVGQFNDSFQPVMDGVANTVRNYAYWLNIKCGKCYVVTPKYPKFIDQEEFEVIRYASTKLPFRPPYRLGMPFFDYKSKKILQEIDFDIVHAHSPFSSGQMALKLAKKKNIPIVATFHSKFYDDFKQALKSDILAQFMVNRVIAFYNQVDYVWTVNESTANTLKEYGFKGNIEVMSNGTEFDDHIDFNENIDYMKTNYNVNENELVFLFVGQHILQKNIKLIIESLAILKKENIKFKMIFVGEGYAKNELIKLSEDLNLMNEVSFMGKIIDRTLLKRFFARADLFLFPSVYDNAPIVTREAAALCTPSIVIKGSNAAEGIIDGVNGYTCENDVVVFANKIKQISLDKNKLKETGLNAKNTIAVTWESIVNKV
ncbi:MAG: glycosyl transferase group 1, partial [Haloplasmataceae bacterium]|nr:glycosyl transferase group 1 [Haloplasmataceae bacterium]